MHPDEVRRGMAHRPGIERLLDPPDERLRERGAPARDLVDVAPRDGIVPRVKAMPYLIDSEDVDIGRQRVVDAPSQRLGREREIDIQMRHLAERVNARIRTTGTVQLELLHARDLEKRALDLPLYRSRIALDLPAAIARPGVLEGQLQPHAALSLQHSAAKPCAAN